MAEERVQKILARAGYGSRRASEELISAGRVRINGQVAVLGSKADPAQDTITIDNQAIAKEQPPVYVAVNKPTGILSEVSPDEPRQTVRDLVPLPGHMFIVGRLDMDSEGLILMTNDGALANRLSHPRYGHEKEYRVLLGARPDERQLEAWRHGVVLEDGYRTAPAEARLERLAGDGAWLRVILREGRKRQIREMGKQTGLPVLRIQRIRIGALLLGELKLGQWRELRPEEVRALKTSTPNHEAAPRLGRAGRTVHPTARRDSSSHRDSSSRPDSSSRRTGSPQPSDHADRSDRPARAERYQRPESAGRPARPPRPGSRPPRANSSAASSGDAGSDAPRTRTPAARRPAGTGAPSRRPAGPSGSRPTGGHKPAAPKRPPRRRP